MALGVEKRLHPRIPVNWPAVVVTAHGSIEGEVRNISVGGAFIQLSKEGDFSGDSQIHLQPSEQRSISVTGRKAWSGNFNFDGKEVISGVGIQFTDISPEDQEFITSLTSAYQIQHLGSPQTESHRRSVTHDEAELRTVREEIS
jgi:PilZ domain